MPPTQAATAGTPSLRADERCCSFKNEPSEFLSVTTNTCMNETVERKKPTLQS